MHWFFFVVCSGGFAAVVALAHAGCPRNDRARCGVISRTQARFVLLVLTCSLAACAVGPDYVPPAAPTPTTYKELKGWKVATPSDGLGRGEWWSFYRDPKLTFLIKQVEISNQTVAAAAAAYEQARAVIRQAQAALLPTLTGSYTFTRTMTGPESLSNQTGSTAAIVTGTPIYTTTYNPQLSASWDLDIWGKVRRQIESNAAAAQATAADLDNAKLSAAGAACHRLFQSARDRLIAPICSNARRRSIGKRLTSCATNSTPVTVPPVRPAARPRTWPPRRPKFLTPRRRRKPTACYAGAI